MRISFSITFFSLILLASLTLTACGKQTSPPAGPEIGLVRLNLTDPDRENWEGNAQRPITTSIWYPAVEGAKMSEIGIPLNRPVFIGGFASRNAALSEAKDKYPLIMMSHGTGGAAMQMMWLASSLAEQGYIVAAVEHHGNTAAEERFDPRAFRMPWERARDVSAVLDQLLSDPVWGARIDPSQIGAVGFSLGGYSVTALAGGQIDFSQFQEFCNSTKRDATCDEQSEFPDAGEWFEAMLENDPALRARMSEHLDSFKDDRIQAVIVLAPALGQAFTNKSLSAITIPYLAIAGSEDKVAPLETNALALVQQIPNAHLIVVQKAGHYVFLNMCNKRGKRFVAVCKGHSEGVKEQAHETARLEAIKFFDAQFNR